MMLQELIEGQNLALPYAGAEAGESVDGIAGTETAVRAAPAEGNTVYTNATPYFSYACGFFYYGGADSSGCARTAGLMYEMPGVDGIKGSAHNTDFHDILPLCSCLWKLNFFAFFFSFFV